MVQILILSFFLHLSCLFLFSKFVYWLRAWSSGSHLVSILYFPSTILVKFSSRHSPSHIFNLHSCSISSLYWHLGIFSWWQPEQQLSVGRYIHEFISDYSWMEVTMLNPTLSRFPVLSDLINCDFVFISHSFWL